MAGSWRVWMEMVGWGASGWDFSYTLVKHY
jgi:hypothetical protein